MCGRFSEFRNEVFITLTFQAANCSGKHLPTSCSRHFDEIAASVNATCVEDGQEQSSPFYAPAVVDYMLQKLMPLAPLWSQMLSKQVTSNAAVEA